VACAPSLAARSVLGNRGNGQLAIDPGATLQTTVPRVSCTATSDISCRVVGGCLDASDERTFGGGMVGCAGAVTQANGASLCGSITPMRVRTASGTDAESDPCNWRHRGIHSAAPDQCFGGCAGNRDAGTRCMLVPAQ
jgi:hypothetical protein